MTPFVCILYSYTRSYNARIVGEQSYILLNISCLQLTFGVFLLVLDPDDVSRWKTNIVRLGTFVPSR